MLIGSGVVFIPLYVVGLLGMTRRLQHYDVPAWHPWVVAAGFGIIILAAAAACQVIQIYVSIRRRDELRDMTGDPWEGRSLEWATPSPPPPYQFRGAAAGTRRGAVLGDQAAGDRDPAIAVRTDYQPIEVPRNSPTGVITAFFATFTGFAMIWHIWWLAVLGVAAAYAVFVWFAWRDVDEYTIPAAEVARIDRAHRQVRGNNGSRNTRAWVSGYEHHSGLLASGRPAAISTPTGWGAVPAVAAAVAMKRPVAARGGPPSKDVIVGFRLLNLHPQRHRDVLRLLRGARGAGRRRQAGGPSGHDLFGPSQLAIENLRACWCRASPAGFSAVGGRVRSQIWTQSGCRGWASGLLGTGVRSC